jgi:hypothetical protein
MPLKPPTPTISDVAARRERGARLSLCLLLSLVGALAAIPARADCPPKTTVSDTIYNADGSPASGRVVIAWPTFLAGTCQVVAGQTSITIQDGALAAQLYPNDAATPAGTSYRVTYYLRSGRITTEYWIVPASGTPVTLSAVRTTAVPVPEVNISPSQVSGLVAALAAKIEIPPACPAGKFLQSTGSSAPPQVSCVDGTGAPLASATVSGTVKTDVDEADPRVYTKATADTLLAAKADTAHSHDAAALTSGVLDPARLPLPAATTPGGVRSGACSGADKVTGISTSGQIECAPDQGGSGGSQHQANGANLASNDPVNFQDSATIAVSNPAAGNLQFQISNSSVTSDLLAANAVTPAKILDGAVTAAKLGVSNPTGAQLSGLGDVNIAAGALSPDRVAGTAEVTSNRGAANGYASLGASGTVEQNPASAQTTPAASKIPLADGAGKIADGWLSSNVTLLGQLIDLAAETEGVLAPARGGTGANNSATTGRFLRGSGTNFATSSGAAAGAGACTNQFVRALNDDSAPTCASVGSADISDGAVTTAKASSALRDDVKNITILAPTTGDTNKVQLQWPAAVTLQKIGCSTDTGTVSIHFDKRSETTPNTAGTDALSAALVCDTDRQVTTTFSSAGVAANQVLNLQIASASGSPAVVRIHVLARLD